MEFSYTQPNRECEIKSVSSFVATFSKAGPEAQLPCLSPIETAADKFCALTWRVLKRDRNSDADDPAMIRHLHDLAALHFLIEVSPAEFLSLASQAFNTDMALNNRKLEGDLASSSNKALVMIQGDRLYADEYDQFVASMSYSRDDERLPFETAVASFGRVVSLLLG